MNTHQQLTLDTHRDRLASAIAAASRTSRATGEALGKASNYQDPHLNDDGLLARRRELREQFSAAARQDVVNLREQVKSSLANVRYVAQDVRPKIANDAAELIRSQQKWEQARTMLDAGVPMENIIRNADLTTVLAIEEFAPSWFGAKHAKEVGIFHDFDADPTAATARFRNEVDRRLVQVTDRETAEAIVAARVGEAQAQAATEWLDHAERRIEGTAGSDMETAVRAQYAESEAASIAEAFSAPAATEAA